MLNLKVRLPNGTTVKATTTKSRLRLRYGRKPKPPVVVERFVVVLVPVPIVETVYMAPPPAPSAEEVAYAILRELDEQEAETPPFLRCTACGRRHRTHPCPGCGLGAAFSRPVTVNGHS